MVAKFGHSKPLSDNPKKCKKMTLRFRRVVDHLPLALAIDTKALESVDAHKVLSVTIQSNLKWDLHTNDVVAKASKSLHILRVLKRGGVPPADLLKVYFALIRSVLEYCCPVWHNVLPVKLSHSIERVRIIFPALHYQEALATTGCVSLHTRRMELCSKLFRKINEPVFRLRHLVPPTRLQAHGRSLRNKNRPSLISCKSERFKRSFFRRCAFMLMACNLGTYGNSMYNLISSFLSNLLYFILSLL